jgi:FMN phosphatase YigB (HAD superfamily)
MDTRRTSNNNIKEAVIKGTRSETLAVFDLDDTLIISDAKIKVLDPKTHEVIKTLTPAEFNFFKPRKKVNLSFSEFEDYDILKKSAFIQHVLDQLLAYYKSGMHVSIVTARSNSNLIRKFFLENGIDIHPELVIAVNDPSYGFKGSIAERKKEALQTLINQGYSSFIFFDDNEENLMLAKELEHEKDVKVKTVKV